MKNKNKILIFFVLMSNLAFAQYTIKKFTINSGGSNSSGGQYQIQGSIGQVDATKALTGGSYSLSGGFWQQQSSVNNEEIIFENSFE